jgi:hypothetical protein
VGRWSAQQIGDMLRARSSAAIPRVEGNRPRNRWPELHDFLESALQPGPRAEQRVTSALARRDAHSLAELDMSLRELRAQGWDERAVARALADLGMEYVPYADDRTCLEWVAWVHHEVVLARE